MLTLDPETPIINVDGVEFMRNNLIGWEHRLVRVYTLDDKTKVTVKMVADFLGCTNTCARSRLTKYSDPKIIYRVILNRKTREPRFKVPKEMIDSHEWYKDPLTKLMLNSKSIKHYIKNK